MKQLFLCLSIFLLFTSCKKNETHSKSLEINAEIIKKTNELYAWDTSNRAFPLPKNLFLPELEKLLNESMEITNADEERIKKSNYPTDMPMMIVGYFMTGLQDFQTGFKIKKITVHGNTAKVFTEFYYDNDPKSTQKIKILLTNENGWKVKNIIYNKGTNSSLKNTLEGFIKYSKETLK